jgi:Zn-finger protein
MQKTKKIEKRNEVIINKQTNTKKNMIYGNILQRLNLENEFCYNGQYNASEYGTGSVVVKKDGCDEWACRSGFNKYRGNIEIQEVSINIKIY